MPPKPLFDLSLFDTDTVVADREAIYAVNPQRHEFQQLDGLHYYSREDYALAGFRDVRDDEFWVRGHIPGRPIFPGVLMIESAAQLVSYFMMRLAPDKGFLGFGGVDGVKFRGTVAPGDRIVLLGKMLEIRPRRCVGAVQGYVDGRLVFEGVITGMWL
jgi:3-hydroxyacyl-[acyl-carrier-protein] dehydratase